MFLRKNKKRKDGKEHIYWSLVETYRTPRGPRQRLVGYLGDLNEGDQSGYRQLLRKMSGETDPSRQQSFLSYETESTVSIDPRKVRVERVRDFGDAFVGVGFWKLLELDKFFSKEIEVGREEISWEAMICFLVVSRFCESMSKLAIAESYVDRSALADILGIDPLKVNKNRLYRAMDEMLDKKEALFTHLRRRYGELFRLDYDLLLYDITSTYFEGECSKNPQAKRGHSRDKRSDCKQVTLALVVTKEGFPLHYEVFDGNRRDVTTVEEIVEAVEHIYGKSKRIWAMDRGMVSEDNLEWLRQRGTKYIVGMPKAMLKKFEKPLLDKTWEQVFEDLEVKKVRSDEYQEEAFVLCRSALRREKELAILNRFMDRIEEGLEKMRVAVNREKRALCDRDKLQRRIGALLKANTRAARFFDVQVTSKAEGKKTRLGITWTRKNHNQDWAQLSAGHYLLRSNVADELSAEEMWRAYINLTQVEEAFRMSKQDIGLRPVHHQTQDRVASHVFICFLSLVLQRTFEQALIRKGLGRSTRKVIEELKTLKSMDVVLRTTAGDDLRLRVVSEPEQSLKILLDHLRLKVPKRLLLPPNVVETAIHPPKLNQALNTSLCP